MGPGVLAAIGAIAGLAQAGGGAMSAYGAGKDARASRRQNQKWHEEGIEQQEEDRKLSRMRLGMDAEQMRLNRPTQALGFISGLQDFSEKRARSGGYLETIRALSRR